MKLNTLMGITGLAIACLTPGSLFAQEDQPPGGRGPGGPGGGRNFDPAQMQQRMMENYKEQLEITDDTEWNAVQPLIQKVMDARRASFSGMGMGRGMFAPRRGGDNAAAGQQGGDRQNRRMGAFGQPSPEAEALQKAIDAKAPKAELKSALTKYQEARKAKQAELEKAQEDLRKVLTARQEAIATVSGLL